jgi:hypothetical protein
MFAFTLASTGMAKDEAAVPGLDVIVKSREIVKSYVADAKAKYAPTDSRYINARKLYLEALGAYAGWTSQLRAAVIAGRTKDLRTDDQFKRLSEGAQAARKAFTDYLEQTGTEATRGLSASDAATGLVDSGVKLWNAVKNRRALERQKLADFIAKEAKWDTWEEIE